MVIDLNILLNNRHHSIYNKLNFKVYGLTTQLFDHDAQLLEIDIKNNSKPIINKPITKFGRQFSDENQKDFMKSPLKESMV